MPRKAILIEDDYEQAVEMIDTLVEAGFEVTHYAWAAQVRAEIDHVGVGIDLLVVDRRLPEDEVDEPSDSTGDSLLPELLDAYPDVPIILFTGYTNLEHHQFATENRGHIPVGIEGEGIDRIQSFDKYQTEKFDARLGEVLNALNQIEEIEVDMADGARLPSEHRRSLQRLGRHFGGTLVRATCLGGGMTDMPVWRCSVFSKAGAHVTSSIVKRSSGSKVPPLGGLHRILPAANVAAHTTSVAGLCDGTSLIVMQDVGAEARSLFALLESSQHEALTHFRAMREFLAGPQPVRHESVHLSQVAKEIWPFEKVVDALSKHNIEIPNANGFVATTVSPQHGDLHGGNVLTVEGRVVLIDFDNGHFGSQATDPVVFFFSLFFHPDSPFRGRDWPSMGQFDLMGEDGFFEGCPASEFFREAWDWIVRSVEGQRELWTLVLTYAIKQTKYDDVAEDPIVFGRAIELASTAERRLNPGAELAY